MFVEMELVTSTSMEGLDSSFHASCLELGTGFNDISKSQDQAQVHWRKLYSTPVPNNSLCIDLNALL